MDAGIITAIASILVAAVAALSAYASQRSAAKTSTTNLEVASRNDAAKDAYERARAFDTETISRQDAELEELRAENADLKTKHRTCDTERDDLRRQLRAVIEQTRGKST
jgi:FtsZ-binding cell division protein ZapB